MVDLVGIEPTTSSMPWKRAPSCATGPLVRTLLSRADDSFIFADREKLVNAATKSAADTTDAEEIVVPFPMTSASFASSAVFISLAISLCLPQAFSAIIDRAHHLHKFPITI